MNKVTVSVLLFFLIVFAACNNNSTMNNTIADTTKTDNGISATHLPSSKNFQTTMDGKQTGLYILKNGDMQVAVTNYGARVVSMIVPDKSGNATDVCVGFGSVQPYAEGADTYFGAIVGRYGNRIAKGKFKLDGKEYALAINNGPNSLHGGKKGFSRVVWDAQQQNDSTLFLNYLSKDGEEGYPGNLNVKVTYTVLKNEQLKIAYEATTDKATVLNLTNHSYFNLNGQGSGNVLNHSVMINANSYTPVDATLIPTGKSEPVKGSPLDFTTATTIGARIDDTTNQQLKFGHGYDHNYVLDQDNTAIMKAAEVVGDKTNIVMDVYTDQPGLQFYTGNFMDGSHTIKGGKKDDHRSAFCMETQHFPDSPNQPGFPSTELSPGQHYATTTIYKFSIKQ